MFNYKPTIDSFSSFIPYLWQAHILNHYVFAETPSKPFRKGKQVFKPTCNPEEEWIKFSIEAATFLSSPTTETLDRFQFASLLIDNLTDEWIKEDLIDVEPEMIFAIYQARWYGIQEAARDHKRFMANKAMPGKFIPKYGKYLKNMVSVPKGVLTWSMYLLDPDEIATIQGQHRAYFWNRGVLILRRDDDEKATTMHNHIIEYMRSNQQKVVESQNKRKSKNSRQSSKNSHQSSKTSNFYDWFNDEMLSESLKSWRKIKGVPARTFQAFTFPGDKSSKSVITPTEREYRSAYKLCLRCGNHLATEPHQANSGNTLFYSTYVKKRTQVVSTGAVEINEQC